MKGFILFFSLSLVVVWQTIAAAQSCPPAPTCSSSSSATLNQLKGSFGCSGSLVDSTGATTVQVLEGTSDGKGNITGSRVQNGNGASGFSISPQHTATYCMNTDGSGFIFPDGGCPLAFVLDGSKKEVQALSSDLAEAFIINCQRK